MEVRVLQLSWARNGPPTNKHGSEQGAFFRGVSRQTVTKYESDSKYYVGWGAKATAESLETVTQIMGRRV